MQLFQTRPKTVHHRSLHLLLQSMQGYVGTGLQLQATFQAVVPVPEAGRLNSSAQYQLNQRGLAWSKLFACLAYSDQTHPPTLSQRVVLEHAGGVGSPFPTQSSLPFCAGVQFSCDSIRAFNDRIKIRENRGL